MTATTIERPAMDSREVTVLCLVIFGDQAVLQVPGQDEPVRWPVKAIMDDTGLNVTQVPGRSFTARYRETREEGRTFAGFRLAD